MKLKQGTGFSISRHLTAVTVSFQRIQTQTYLLPLSVTGLMVWPEFSLGCQKNAVLGVQAGKQYEVT